MILRFIFNILVFILLINCSGTSNNVTPIDQQLESPESQYIKAMMLFDEEQYDQANEIFENIERIYPLSNEAIQSQIMQGFIDYIILDYDAAIIKFSKVIKRYPSLKNLDYVYYMKALCYYEQVTHEGLDGKFNELALINLNQVIKRFPESKYAKDSYQKIVLVKSNIAAKHMMIGRFYQKEEKYTASLNRYKIVVDSFDETKFVPEALFRISEIYLNLGMIEDSEKTAAILGYNYPDSKWYKYIYDNLTKKDKGSIFSKSFNKVFN